MIYKSKIGNLDLNKITRLYPAVIVDSDGEVAEMSLEWADLYGEKVKIVKYILVFDYTPHNSEIKDKKIVECDTRDELVIVMNEVAQFFQD